MDGADDFVPSAETRAIDFRADLPFIRGSIKPAGCIQIVVNEWYSLHLSKFRRGRKPNEVLSVVKDQSMVPPGAPFLLTRFPAFEAFACTQFISPPEKKAAELIAERFGGGPN